MAVSSEFNGVLIGYDSFTKDNNTTHTYAVLITQKPDVSTGLFKSCGVVEVREKTPVTFSIKHGQKVHFWGEQITTKTGSFMVYNTLEQVK